MIFPNPSQQKKQLCVQTVSHHNLPMFSCIADTGFVPAVLPALGKSIVPLESSLAARYRGANNLWLQSWERILPSSFG